MGDSQVRLKAALRFMRGNFRRQIAMEDIAGTVGLSAAYFGQVFAKVVGKSAVDVLNELRVAAAAADLVNTRRPIGRIASDSGFAHRRHFGRVFKDLTGVTPREYRRRKDARPGSRERAGAKNAAGVAGAPVAACACPKPEAVPAGTDRRCVRCGLPVGVVLSGAGHAGESGGAYVPGV